jgi:2-polyprenyl-3-methyl-5-hydroxy-6-metoxy-1,4-benzoquinol methylase
MFRQFLKKLKIPCYLGIFGVVMYTDISETAFYLNNLYYSNSKYSNNEFWENEYKEDASQYDWYVRYSEISEIIRQEIKPNDEILHIGAGNSLIAEEMYKENYKHITNIDISKEVVKEMSNYYNEKNLDIKYLQMDMLNLEFEKDSFDVVLDKAGSDVLLVGKKPFKTYRKFMLQLEKVLKSNGKFVFVTLFSNFPIKQVVDQRKWEVRDFVIKEKYSVLVLRKL